MDPVAGLLGCVARRETLSNGFCRRNIVGRFGSVWMALSYLLFSFESWIGIVTYGRRYLLRQPPSRSPRRRLECRRRYGPWGKQRRRAWLAPRFVQVVYTHNPGGLCSAGRGHHHQCSLFVKSIQYSYRPDEILFIAGLSSSYQSHRCY